MLFAVRLETNHVVGGIKEAVGDFHAVAVHDVNAVVVPIGSGIHFHVVHIYILALVVNLVPTGGVAQGDARDSHTGAFAEIDIRRATGLGGTVVLHPVGKSTAVHQIHQIVGGSKTLAGDGSLTYHTDILLIHSHHESCPLHSRVLHIIEWVGRAEQSGSQLQVQRHIRLEVDAAAEVTARREQQFTATMCTDIVDGILDSPRIHKLAVSHRTEILHVVLLSRLRESAQHSRQTYSNDDKSS